MNSMLTPLPRVAAALVATACFFTTPASALAKKKDHDHDKHDKHEDKHRYHHVHGGPPVYFGSRPRTSFVLSFGNGYAGRGYYYGPPNSSYYYRQPGVVYYRSREAYYGQPVYRSDSLAASVQRALARRGYYRGPIDGDIGPGSRRAIAAFQDDAGMRVTGSIDSELLDELGIR